MIDLDDLQALREADGSDALGVVEETAEQWIEAIERTRANDEMPTKQGINRVLFCGMGGSGIAGDVLQAIASQRSAMGVTVVKGYSLPQNVGPNALVICASYSGNTEETLSCFDEALARNARVVVIATGGELAERARAQGIPVYEPRQGLQPRAALASLVVPTLMVAERIGILPDMSDELAEAHGVLSARVSQLSRDVPESDNQAKTIARQIHGKLPLIWGQEGHLAVGAYRWRCQINENAKQLAFWSVLPELDHNELVGFEQTAPNLRDIALIVLRAPGEHPRIAKRIEVTLGQVREHVGVVVEAWAAGDLILSQLLSTCLLGDLASVYLAYLRGVDPTPVHVIERLKAELAG